MTNKHTLICILFGLGNNQLTLVVIDVHLFRPSLDYNQILASVDPRIAPPYNIAGSGHSRYNRKAYDKIMGPATHYVTVVSKLNSMLHTYTHTNRVKIFVGVTISHCLHNGCKR